MTPSRSTWDTVTATTTAKSSTGLSVPVADRADHLAAEAPAEAAWRRGTERRAARSDAHPFGDGYAAEPAANATAAATHAQPKAMYSGGSGACVVGRFWPPGLSSTKSADTPPTSLAPQLRKTRARVTVLGTDSVMASPSDAATGGTWQCVRAYATPTKQSDTGPPSSEATVLAVSGWGRAGVSCAAQTRAQRRPAPLLRLLPVLPRCCNTHLASEEEDAPRGGGGGDGARVEVTAVRSVHRHRQRHGAARRERELEAGRGA